ncbi:MAG: hypothetical protein A2X94_10860 [Bdellovibrionales bacterium GWB1_55_8]|nr:MAG: hypothetical protein A2X94_10860 [Bdellovibrionales bacterium GWB1_55_8]
MNTNNAVSVWNHGFGPLFADFFAIPTEWQPACDVEETDDHYLLSLETPGVARDQIKLEVLENRVQISGEKKRAGKFQRTFTLPAGVNVDKVEASYQDGILTVRIPKPEAALPRQIKITQ